MGPVLRVEPGPAVPGEEIVGGAVEPGDRLAAGAAEVFRLGLGREPVSLPGDDVGRHLELDLARPLARTGSG